MSNNELNKILEKARANVGKGWWPIVEEYLPQIVRLAPECEIIVKEKFGTLRIGVYGQMSDRDEVMRFKREAELASATVCEECGNPGKLHMELAWFLTLCDRCADEHRKKYIEK